MRPSIAPPEDDSPLIVHSDAVLTNAISRERFESVSGWYAEVVQSCRLVEIAKLAERYALNPRIDPLDLLKSEQRLSLAIRKRCDHQRIVTQLVMGVKRRFEKSPISAGCAALLGSATNPGRISERREPRCAARCLVSRNSPIAISMERVTVAASVPVASMPIRRSRAMQTRHGKTNLHGRRNCQTPGIALLGPAWSLHDEAKRGVPIPGLSRFPDIVDPSDADEHLIRWLRARERFQSVEHAHQRVRPRLRFQV